MTLIQVVDEDGRTIGDIEKLAAHQDEGVWHRAISVLVFNPQGELLIQQRADTKYHFGGRWANSCCTHPSSAETPMEAAARALQVELRIDASPQEIGIVRYEARDEESGLIEREHDHVFLLQNQTGVDPNPSEVQAVRWIALDDLRKEITKQPERFAPWLPLVLDVL